MKQNGYQKACRYFLVTFSLQAEASKFWSVYCPGLQASRPRSMLAPIPFGIGVDADKSDGTRWSVDHLAKFGFSISSDDVKLFKQSAASTNDNPGDKATQFTQWVADNVDHNICTLTGKCTFHGMGIISVSSSKLKYEIVQR